MRCVMSQKSADLVCFATEITQGWNEGTAVQVKTESRYRNWKESASPTTLQRWPMAFAFRPYLHPISPFTPNLVFFMYLVASSCRRLKVAAENCRAADQTQNFRSMFVIDWRITYSNDCRLTAVLVTVKS